MLRLERKKLVAILTAAFLMLETAGAVTASATQHNTPWYAAWYLWLGLGLFIIVLVAVLGTTKERE